MARTRNYRSKRRSKIQTKHRNNTRRGGVRRKFRRNRRTRKGGNFLRRMFNKGKVYAGEYGQDVSAASSRAASGISNASKSVSKSISGRGRRMKDDINAMRERSQGRSRARSQRANMYSNCEEAKIIRNNAKINFDRASDSCQQLDNLKMVLDDKTSDEGYACTLLSSEKEPLLDTTNLGIKEQRQPPFNRKFDELSEMNPFDTDQAREVVREPGVGIRPSRSNPLQSAVRSRKRRRRS